VSIKTAIVYYSKHHGNTKKLLDAIATSEDVDLIDAAGGPDVELSAYDLVGFASGIYYSKFHESVLQVADKNLPQGKNVFLLYTCGTKRKNYTDMIRKIIDAKCAQLLGVHGCRGFDTFGPLKLIGGIAKGRPNDEDVAGAVGFFREIVKSLKGGIEKEH